MEKDKQLAIPGESKNLEQISNKFGLVQKILKEDNDNCPLTIDWWNTLPEFWKMVFLFFVKFQSTAIDKYLDFDILEIIEAWYKADLENWKKFKEQYPKIGKDIPLGRPKIDELFMQKLFLLERIYLTDYEMYGINFASLDISSLDILYLKNLQNLKTLDLSRNYITDIEALRGLQSLKSLTIGSHKIANTDALKKLINLEYLDISCGDIADLDFLTPLKNLKKLVAKGCEIEHLSIPTVLICLEQVNLSENNISDLGGLVGLVGLKNLDLLSNKIFDVTPLSELSNLEEIDLSHNQIRNIHPLTRLKKLKKLNIIGNHVDYISILKFKQICPNVEIQWK